MQHAPVQTDSADSWKEQIHRLQSDLAQARGQLQQQRLLTAQLQAQADAAGASLAEAEGQLQAAQADAAIQAGGLRDSEVAHSTEMLRLQVRPHRQASRWMFNMLSSRCHPHLLSSDACGTKQRIGASMLGQENHRSCCCLLARDSIDCCLGGHLSIPIICTVRTG